MKRGPVGRGALREPPNHQGGTMYTIGYHSSDDRYCHVSWDSTDLFDVTLYGNPGEPQDEADKAKSLDALRLLVSRANKQAVIDHDLCSLDPIVRLATAAIDTLVDDRDPSTVDLLTLHGIISEFVTGKSFCDGDEAIDIIADILRRYTT